MTKNKYRLSFFILILLSVLFLLGGCSIKEDEEIVTINNRKLTLEDFKYDIYLIELDGNSRDEYYSESLGISYWDYEVNDITMRDAAKDTILSRVILYEILNDQAKQANLSLTDDEITANQIAVDSFIKSTTEKVVAEAGLNKDMLLTAYNKFSLGDKYYKQLAKTFMIDEESIAAGISPEDYREYKTETLYVPTVKNENQEIVVLSIEEVEASYATITEALEKVKAGADFAQLKDENANLSYYARDFILTDNLPEQEYKNSAVLLENDEYSEIVSTNYGYYIIHMLDNNASSRYEKAIAEAISAEENTQFQVVYEKLKAQYNIKINSEYWDTIVIGKK
ncbi:MAG TPA: hypothetical protein VJZ06_08355 [Mobilitalea sp.]|nr:hypothetical protein [Mobilitalea sp.]